MRVLQLTVSSQGGAGIAALRLHRALRAAGIDSAFLSKDLVLDYKGESMEDDFFYYKPEPYWKRIMLKLRHALWPITWVRIKRELGRINKSLKYETISLPFSKYRLEDHPLLLKADVINLHWTGDLLDYERFFSAYDKPIVWTLHDMNPFKGLFHYEADEIRNTVAEKLNSEVARIKRIAIQKVKKGAIVCPSNWLLEKAKQSKVFDHFSTQVCISNAIDLEVFQTQKVIDLRKKYDIQPDEMVLLYSAGAMNIPRKGAAMIVTALEDYRRPLTLLTLGKGELKISNENIKVIPLGFLSEPSEIAASYIASNALVLPSLEDNLPNTMLEAFATGTPVIAFTNGGMREHIEVEFNGVLAETMNSESLLQAIIYFTENSETYDPDKIRSYAESKFSMQEQAESYKTVYQNLINQNR